MSQIPTIQLNNGIAMPQLGFGTAGIGSHDEVVQAVSTALKTGYRLIDTAAAYGNEEAVGEAIRRSGVPREEIFVTTKLGDDDHGYERAQAAFAASLDRLGLDYVDLYLIHWPNPHDRSRDEWVEMNHGNWRFFEEANEAGRMRAIGVSNFHPEHLEALRDVQTIAPAVNQIRFSAGYRLNEIEDYCRKAGIVLEAYTPLGKGTNLLEHETLVTIARAHQRTPAQVALRYAMDRGYVPIPRSSNDDRIRENYDAFGFTLTTAEREQLDAIQLKR